MSPTTWSTSQIVGHPARSSAAAHGTGGNTPTGTSTSAGAGTGQHARGQAPEQSTGQATMQLHEEELHARKQPVEKGDVRLRKEVVTEHQTLDVPVQREEVVVERRPLSGKPTAGTDIQPGEEIRIPVKEEQVHVEKRPIVREEVSVLKLVKELDVVTRPFAYLGLLGDR